MDRRGEPGFRIGALLGGLLAMPMALLFHVGRLAAGLPDLPFELFDAVTRMLPGSLVTLGIDTLVALLRIFGVEELSVAAKAVERSLALLAFLAAGSLTGGFLVLLAARRHPLAGARDGAAAGLLIAVPALLFRLLGLFGLRDIGPTATGPLVSSLWTGSLFVLWGAAAGYALRRYRDASPAGGEAVSLDRRSLLIRWGGAIATLTVTGAWVAERLVSFREREDSEEPWSSDHPLPNAGAQVRPAPGTRPELTPRADHYRIDINTRTPRLREEEWRLRLGGLVASSREWTLEALRRYEPIHQFVTLSCISNPVAGSLIGTQRWTGVPLRRLIEEAGPSSRAAHLNMRAADGFHESLPLAEALGDGRIMLVYAWDGLPLSPEHGFPLRLYIPGRYGMKQPKWLVSIDVAERAETGYWVRRGWDREARMKSTSVIDVVGVDMGIAQADGSTRIPIGGIAHAGDRGISRVEVRVDDGEWREARLRQPLSDRSWVIWRYDWPFREGRHTFAVRCVDGMGQAQVAEDSPVRPSGATGLHGRTTVL
jgi:DMSO/TMAO reductase YedYZ molybdopterin-dependent catalytic subunit